MSTETTDVAMLGKNQWSHVLGLILASLIMSDRVAGASFEAKGILNIKTIDIQNLQSELELNFDVSVAGCQWFIATAHHPMSDSHDISNWEIGSEGSNEIYQVAFYNKATLNPKSINDSIGFLEQDKVPQNVQGNTAAEIWLAFASACYMEHVTNNMLEPVYGLPALLRDQGFTERSIYEIFEAEPRLPSHIVYISDKLFGISGGQLTVVPLPSAFAGGIPRAEYQVTRTTNLSGLTLPTQFTFTEKMMTPVGGHELRDFRIVEGTVTSLIPQCSRLNFRPNMGKATYIDERRFIHADKPVPALTYMVTNNIWPSMDSDFLEGLYKHETNVMAHIVSTNVTEIPVLRPHPVRGIAVLFCLFVPSVIFSAFLLKTWHAGRKSKRNEPQNI